MVAMTCLLAPESLSAHASHKTSLKDLFPLLSLGALILTPPVLLPVLSTKLKWRCRNATLVITVYGVNLSWRVLLQQGLAAL